MSGLDGPEGVVRVLSSDGGPHNLGDRIAELQAEDEAMRERLTEAEADLARAEAELAELQDSATNAPPSPRLVARRITALVAAEERARAILAEADKDVARRRSEATQEAKRIVEAASREAAKQLAETRQAVDRRIVEARAARETALAALAAARAERDRALDALAGVRTALLRAAEGLPRSAVDDALAQSGLVPSSREPRHDNARENRTPDADKEDHSRPATPEPGSLTEPRPEQAQPGDIARPQARADAADDVLFHFDDLFDAFLGDLQDDAAWKPPPAETAEETGPATGEPADGSAELEAPATLDTRPHAAGERNREPEHGEPTGDSDREVVTEASQPQLQAPTTSEPEAEPEPQLQAHTTPGPEAEAEPQPEPQAHTTTEPGPEPKPEAEPEPEPQAHTTPEPESEPELGPETDVGGGDRDDGNDEPRRVTVLSFVDDDVATADEPDHLEPAATRADTRRPDPQQDEHLGERARTVIPVHERRTGSRREREGRAARSAAAADVVVPDIGDGSGERRPYRRQMLALVGAIAVVAAAASPIVISGVSESSAKSAAKPAARSQQHEAGAGSAATFTQSATAPTGPTNKRAALGDACDGSTGWQARRVEHALSLLSYPWRKLGYTVGSAPAKDGVLATISTGRHQITAYVRSCSQETAQQLAGVLAHQMGVAVDDVHGNSTLHSTYLRIRGLPAGTPWFPCATCDPTRSGVWDYAESFVTWQLGGPVAPMPLAAQPDAGQLAKLTALYPS